ncbi:MAG: ABC transporter permease, partial [Gallionella sp.]
MSFMPVILWSDALVFLLLAAGIAGVWYVRRQEHLLLPWRRVAQSATAMVSLLVLALFLAVGLLDTLHYRAALPDKSDGKTVYSSEVLSVFDKLVEPLRAQTEKTYSAPLAVTLYAKESAGDARGSVVRGYPRLRYGGAHLGDEKQRGGDVLKRALIGALGGLLAGLLIALGSKRLLTRRSLPLRPMLIATLAISALIGATANLAAAYHVLGTDKVGQDVLYLSLKSIRTGLIIGTVTTLVTLPLALLLGIAAGYLRGWVDDVIQYIYTVLSSIPSVLLIAAAVLMMQVTIETHPHWFDTAASRADLRLVFLCLILGVTSWTGLCRLLRGETLKLRELEYIQAAQAFGVSSLRILTRHIVPNVMHIILIALVMDFSALVLAEAVLSYVG